MTADEGETGSGDKEEPQEDTRKAIQESRRASEDSAEDRGGPGGSGAVRSAAEEQRENRRSAVRIGVTYVAAGFLFLVGAGAVGFLFAIGDIETGKDMFLAILPVAAAIVTYWYASRKGDESTVKIIEALRKKEDE